MNIDISKFIGGQFFEFRGEYSVYEHVFNNGKKYIGITKCTDKRWKDGEGYRDNIEMYEEIKKEGWDNIQHNVIVSGLLYDVASKLEKYLIRVNKSIGNVYNKAPGGATPASCYSKNVNKVINVLKHYMFPLDYYGDVTALIRGRDNEEFAILVNYIDMNIQKLPGYKEWLYADEMMFGAEYLAILKYSLSGKDTNWISKFGDCGKKNIESHMEVFKNGKPYCEENRRTESGHEDRRNHAEGLHQQVHPGD